MQINLVAPINKTSYGYVSVNILKELSKLAEVSLFPIGPIEVESQYVDVVRTCIQNAGLFSNKAPSVRIFHQHSLDLFPSDFTFGFPIFELDTFNDVEKHHICGTTGLFVTSKWAEKIVHNVRKNYVSVIPLGVDTSIFYPKEQPADSTTRFLNIGKLEKRKGLDILARAFVEEFSQSEDVELFFSCHNRFLNVDQNRQWDKLLKLDRRIKFIPRLDSSSDICDLINMCDCGVYPSHAEGWNMPALETLACGKHLIITDYSASTEFATSDNSLLIQTTELEDAYDDIWPVFKGQGKWAKVGDEQISQLKSYMRHIYNLKQQNNLMINSAGVYTAQQFSWERTAKQIITEVSNWISFDGR